MSQPKFVPIKPEDRVQKDLSPETPERWKADRPAEISNDGQPRGDLVGSIGPDQGYALKLARSFSNRLQRHGNESEEDAIVGCTEVALKRASLYGRAPVVYDLEFAFTLWGYLGGAPDDLVSFRVKLFSQVSHDYVAQRKIVDHVRDEVFTMNSNEIRARLHDWTALIEANLAPRVNKRTEAMKLLADVGGNDEE
jgi:hypothetical protein